MAIYMNYPYYVEFLDMMLRRPVTKSMKINILQQNLFVALTSAEMIALVRLMSIMHISVCMPLRWLSGKTHELSEYGWGPMSMGQFLDKLKSRMKEIIKKPYLVNDREFMMTSFDEFSSELPPLNEYLNITFKKKKI